MGKNLIKEEKKVKYQKKYIILLGIIIILIIIFICGCKNIPSIPTVPGLNPNPNINPENSTVSYIKVVASSDTMEVNQSQQFVVKGYNSNDEWVILDKSKIILWKWTVTGLCPTCIEGQVSLYPKSNSLTTNFSSGVTGKFYIGAYYKENDDAEIISHFVEVQVISKVKTIYDINSK